MCTHSLSATKYRLKKHILILGQEINFDFEVEKNALVGFYSCGAWFNGEYYIIDSTWREALGGCHTIFMTLKANHLIYTI